MLYSAGSLFSTGAAAGLLCCDVLTEVFGAEALVVGNDTALDAVVVVLTMLLRSCGCEDAVDFAESDAAWSLMLVLG